MLIVKTAPKEETILKVSTRIYNRVFSFIVSFTSNETGKQILMYMCTVD